MQYHECPICGANLDPGERCDCKYDIGSDEILAIRQRHIARGGYCDMIIEAYRLGRKRGKEEAAEDWNRRAEPEARELSMDELRGMVGQPIWTQFNDGSGGHWGLLTDSEFGIHAMIDVDTSYWLSNYGKDWTAYTGKPKEGV